jgi:hypothetical protein
VFFASSPGRDPNRKTVEKKTEVKVFQKEAVDDRIFITSNLGPNETKNMNEAGERKSVSSNAAMFENNLTKSN